MEFSCSTSHIYHRFVHVYDGAIDKFDTSVGLVYY